MYKKNVSICFKTKTFEKQSEEGRNTQLPTPEKLEEIISVIVIADEKIKKVKITATQIHLKIKKMVDDGQLEEAFLFLNDSLNQGFKGKRLKYWEDFFNKKGFSLDENGVIVLKTKQERKNVRQGKNQREIGKVSKQRKL